MFLKGGNIVKFTHLHLHSHYSLLDGLGRIPNIINHTKSLGMEAVALTDHGVMYGAIEFSKKASDAGIKPIIGCELYVAPRSLHDKINRLDNNPYHLIVLCENNEGYHNLLKLVSLSHLEGYYYKPRVDKNILRQYHNGLICLTGCLVGEVSRAASQDDLTGAEKALLEYRDIFGKDKIFVELQHHPELDKQNTSNKNLITLAKKHHLPLVATNDVHYLNYDDAEAQDALLCIQTGKFMSDPDRMSMKENGVFLDLSMKNAEQMSKHFSDIPEAISNTNRIADMCNLHIKTGQFIFPAFPVPNHDNPNDYLKNLCISGLWQKIAGKNQPEGQWLLPPDINPEYSSRLYYELDIISKTGFSSYILMVADYTNEAKKRGISTNTRGSAAGSLVCFLANITDIDPLKYNLIFERFLNPERISWPDVDLDIADERRGELINYVAEKYGTEKVAQIITFGTIAAKNSIRDVGRVLGIPYNEVDSISKMIPFGMSLNEAIESSKDLADLYKDNPTTRRLIDLAKKIEGVARHASVHAAGVVISDQDITNYVPVQRVKDESGVVTQYAMNDLEAVGLVKMDFLGLANLTIIERALKIIKATEKTIINLENLSLDDSDTYSLLTMGYSSGVFQLESDGMKRYLKELKPTTINDIIAMVALYRPGPMELIPEYIAGKNGLKKITYLHPKLEPILKDTYGIAVYQEQIIRIAMDLCGFSYGEADVLRKAIGKKKKELLLEQREKWITKAIANQINKKLAEKLFDFVEPFARYGFNKAHATSYGIIAYQTAYLKAHFPSQFMAAWLTSEQNRDIEKVSFALQECRRMGIEVLPPDVNESFADFGVVVNEESKIRPIRFGLGAIKNVGRNIADMVVQNRKNNGPFESLEDFVDRLGQKIVNRKTMESLIRAGAFDRFEERNRLLEGLDQILKFAQLSKQNGNGQVGLFNDDVDSAINKLLLPECLPATPKQRLAWEKELLGIYLSDHPLNNIKSIIGDRTNSISALDQTMLGKTVRVTGLIIETKHIMTKSGKPMAFVKIDDSSGTIELIIFPTVLSQSKNLWEKDNIITADGKINDKDGAIKVLVDRAWETKDPDSIIALPPLLEKNEPNARPKTSHLADNKSVRTLTVKIPPDTRPDNLKLIKQLFSENPGDTSVELIISQGSTGHIIRPNTKISLNDMLKARLVELVGSNNLII